MSAPESASPPTPAELYEDVLVTHLFRPLAVEVLKVAAPEPGDRLIDIACGTGIVLREAAGLQPTLPRLTGIDLNPMMIDVARSITSQLGLTADLYDVSVESLPLESNAYTLAYCQQGLQFFPDPQAALNEINRVLDANGRLVNVTWQSLDRHPFVSALNDVCVEHTGVEALAAPFSLGDPESLTSLLTETGFREPAVTQATVTISWDDPQRNTRMLLMGGTAAIPSLQKLTAEERAELVEQIIGNSAPIFEQHSENGVMTMEWHANVAVARK